MRGVLTFQETATIIGANMGRKTDRGEGSTPVDGADPLDFDPGGSAPADLEAGADPAELEGADADPALEAEIADAMQLETPPGSAYVTAHRRNPSTRRLERFGRYPLEDFDPDDLARRYGGGRWIFVFHGPKGTRRNVILGRRTLDFSPDLIPEGAARSSSSAPAPAPVPLAPPGLGPFDPFQLYLESQKQFQTLLMTLVTSLIGKQSGGAGELLEAVKLGRELSPRGESLGNSLELVQSIFQNGIELGRSAAGGDGDPSDALLSTALSKLTDVITTHASSSRAPKPRAVAPAPAAAPASSAAAGDPMQKYLAMLVAEYRADHEPYTVGYFIGERVPLAFRPALLSFAKLPAPVRLQQLAIVAPELGAAGEWVDEVARGVRDAILGDSSDGDESAAGGGGDGSDGASDGDAHPGSDGGSGSEAASGDHRPRLRSL